jgi:hypothetical protein
MVAANIIMARRYAAEKAKMEQALAAGKVAYNSGSSLSDAISIAYEASKEDTASVRNAVKEASNNQSINMGLKSPEKTIPKIDIPEMVSVSPIKIGIIEPIFKKPETTIPEMVSVSPINVGIIESIFKKPIKTTIPELKPEIISNIPKVIETKQDVFTQPIFNAVPKKTMFYEKVEELPSTLMTEPIIKPIVSPIIPTIVDTIKSNETYQTVVKNIGFKPTVPVSQPSLPKLYTQNTIAPKTPEILAVLSVKAEEKQMYNSMLQYGTIAALVVAGYFVLR